MPEYELPIMGVLKVIGVIPEAVISEGIASVLFILQDKVGEGEQTDSPEGMVQEEGPVSVPDITKVVQVGGLTAPFIHVSPLFIVQVGGLVAPLEHGVNVVQAGGLFAPLAQVGTAPTVTVNILLIFVSPVEALTAFM